MLKFLLKGALLTGAIGLGLHALKEHELKNENEKSDDPTAAPEKPVQDRTEENSAAKEEEQK